MYVSWVFADRLRMVMSSIMRWRSGEVGCVIGNSCLWTAQNVQSLQTGDCLPMPSLQSNRPTGHTETSDNQILKSNIRIWAIRLKTFATGSLPRSGLVQRQLWNIWLVTRSRRLDTRELHHRGANTLPTARLVAG